MRLEGERFRDTDHYKFRSPDEDICIYVVIAIIDIKPIFELG